MASANICQRSGAGAGTAACAVALAPGKAPACCPGCPLAGVSVPVADFGVLARGALSVPDAGDSAAGPAPAFAFASGVVGAGDSAVAVDGGGSAAAAGAAASGADGAGVSLVDGAGAEAAGISAGLAGSTAATVSLPFAPSRR